MSKAEELKAKISEAQENSDIATMYVLQEEVLATFDEEALSSFFANVLDLAMENLTNTLESCQQFDLNEVQDFATLRALYEYAMEHYDSGAITDASALFEVLSGITNSQEFSTALKYHWKSAEQGISLDNFLNQYADIAQTENNNTFYISAFSKKAQDLLNSKKNNAE